MKPPDRSHTHAGALDAGVAGLPAQERQRFLIYLSCLTVAFGLYLLIHGRGEGILFWALAMTVVAGLMSGFFITDFARQGRLLQGAAILAAIVALTYPLGFLVTGQDTLAAVV